MTNDKLLGLMMVFTFLFFNMNYTLSTFAKRSPEPLKYISSGIWQWPGSSSSSSSMSMSSSSGSSLQLIIMCGGTLVGGNGGRGIGRMSSSLLLMPQCKLPDKLLPLCKCRRLEPKPENEFNTDFPFN